jgi:hypothetical protein
MVETGLNLKKEILWGTLNTCLVPLRVYVKLEQGK